MFQRLIDRSGTPMRKKKPTRRTNLAVDSLDNRVLLSGVTATYTLQNDWATGYQAQVELNNTDATAVPNWKLEFDMPSNISSIWNAQVSLHTGNHYVITGLSWDSALAGNSLIEVGFVAAPGNNAPPPANLMLNGVPLGTQAASAPAITVAGATANVGSSSATTATFVVSLSKPATSAVVVSYATADGTAKAGTDYAATTGTLTFAPGQTSLKVAVPIPAVAGYKADSTFTLNLSAPSGATLSGSSAVETIHNLNTPPATSAITFTNTSDWGTGFNGAIDIKNIGTTTVNNWVLDFDFAGSITSIWNASLNSHVGNHYQIAAASWNNSLSPGATASVGFGATPGGYSVAPTNFVLTPPISGSTGGGGIKAPVAVADTASTYAGNAVVINVLANDTDPNNLAISIASVTQPANGTVAINIDKTLSYTPKSGFAGSDPFTYTITDSLGGTSVGSVAVTVMMLPAPSSWSAHEYSPFVDMTLYPTYDLVSASKASGVKDFTLAFITADSANKPAWGGYTSYEVNGGSFDLSVRTQITNLRAIGGDVMVSFGGAANQEMAQVITNVTTLKNSYESVINAYNLTHIDFDIEGAAGADHASIDRRSQAIALVQKDMAAAGKSLEVWYTLPVLPTGLTADGLYSLQSALKYGVTIGGVNIMAMDYGESAAPNPQGQMGTYAIQAGTSLFNQLRTLYGSTPSDAKLWSMVGITPMIGMNDDTLEVFDKAAAQQLVTWAKSKGIGRLAMWSMNRDRANPAGAITYVESTSSSLAQQPYDFSKIFEGFVS